MPNPSTTEIVPFTQIAQSVIVLRDGSLRAVIEVSAINFELRSSEEQGAILQQFQAFLNSVDFPMQMVIQSRRFDISGYVALVNQTAGELSNELLKVQAQEYGRFVQELSELSNIMSKKFYVVLPFHLQADQASGKGVLGGIKDVFSSFKKKPKQAPTLSDEQLANYQVQLAQRADLILGGLSGMGLKGHLLAQEELTKLFADLYNPVVPTAKEKTT